MKTKNSFLDKLNSDPKSSLYLIDSNHQKIKEEK
jgi:hypothetical protein